MNAKLTRRHAAPGLRPGAAAPALLLALGLLWPGAAGAHGVALTSGTGPAAWVQAVYTGGEPVSYAKVRITNPAGRTHQVGHADAAGRFAWLPDAPGDWRAAVEDGMGHRVEAVLQWHRQDPAPRAAAAPADGLRNQPLWARLLWGLLFLWGAVGLLAWLRARRHSAARGGMEKGPPS